MNDPHTHALAAGFPTCHIRHGNTLLLDLPNPLPKGFDPLAAALAAYPGADISLIKLCPADQIRVQLPPAPVPSPADTQPVMIDPETL